MPSPHSKVSFRRNTFPATQLKVDYVRNIQAALEAYGIFLVCEIIADDGTRDLVELLPAWSRILAPALDGRCFYKHNDDLCTT
jgi:hypothetical protein